MKRLFAAAMFALLVGLTARPAVAVPDDYDDTQSHPIRIIAYLASPIGFTLEWLIFRPFHYLVSRPALEPVFGHTPHGENQVY